jgi:DNA polymerase-3 subunit delta'
MALPWHRTHLDGLLARRDRLPHAMLIRGPGGIGKLAFATALARALLCEQPVASGEGCGTCPGCTWLEQGTHPDFRLVEPEKPGETAEAGEGKEKKASLQIDVGQVRELEQFLHLSTHRGKARVVLIHPAEALNVNAANALLKNLEEPPPQTYFLLVAHRWHHLLPTIRSRCQDVALPLPDARIALEWLKAEGLAKPELALAHAGGAPLLATKFDQDYWDVRERMLKLIDGGRFDPMAAAEALRDAAPAVVVALLQRWAFDLAMQNAGGNVRYNPDHAVAVAKLAPRLNALETLRFQRSMVRLQRIVHHPLNPRLFLEDLFLAYARLLNAGDGTHGAQALRP